MPKRKKQKKEKRPADMQDSNQVIRFHIPVKIEGWTPENGADILQTFIGTFPNDPEIGKVLHEHIVDIDPEGQKDILRQLAKTEVLMQILPFFTQASERLGLEPQEDIPPEIPLYAFIICQSIVEELCQQQAAHVRNGVLQVEDTVLAAFTRSRLGRKISLFSQVAGGQQITRITQTITWFAIYCIESFRHAFHWDTLSPKERSALLSPCQQAVETIFGAQGLEAMRKQVPWPFAFPLWYVRFGPDLPTWVQRWEGQGIG